MVAEGKGLEGSKLAVAMGFVSAEINDSEFLSFKLRKIHLEMKIPYFLWAFHIVNEQLLKNYSPIGWEITQLW